MATAFDILRDLTEHFPARGTPVDKLTERDRMALCIAAGVEVDVSTELVDGKYMLTVRTKRQVGIADMGDGKYAIFTK